MALCAGGDGGEGGGCGDDGEGDRGDGRSVCTGAVVLAVSLMSASNDPVLCVSQCLLFIPSIEVELKILIVSNYLLDCDGGVARGYRPSMNCSRRIQGQG